MKRYLNLYFYFLRFSFSKAMEFRVDFFFRIFMDLIYYLINIAFFKILFLHTPILGGWSEDQMMVFVGCFLFIDGLNMSLFSTNLWWLPFHINKGELDYYLIRPVSPLFFLSLKEFSANSFVNFIMAFGILIYTLTNYTANYSVDDLILLTFLLLNGTFLLYLIQIHMIIPVFWTQSSRGFIDLFYSLGVAMERPHLIFKGLSRLVFTFIIPLSLIASYPAMIFFEGLNLQKILVVLGITLVYTFSLYYWWNRGLKVYSSASS